MAPNSSGPKSLLVLANVESSTLQLLTRKIKLKPASFHSTQTWTQRFAKQREQRPTLVITLKYRALT
jgi:hypothetical protein